MNKGTDVPAGPSASDRLALAQAAHAAAVTAYEDAQRSYVSQVNALPLPRLMDGGKVRVTDLDSVSTVMAAAMEGAGTREQAHDLFREVMAYRNDRRAAADALGLGKLAEAVIDGAAEMIRIAEEA